MQNTRMLILAAGLGSRLMPLTKDKPKSMVPYRGRAIIDCILDVARICGISEIGVIGGYKAEVLRDFVKDRITHFYTNENYDSTNMVETLFCAREFLQESIDRKQDVVISYADIIYKPSVLKALLLEDKEVSVVVDMEWMELWKKRFEDPLSDAESLKIRDNKIIELGRKPLSYEDIEAQYIGLFKFAHTFLPNILHLYDSLDTSRIYDGKDFKNMFMTSFIMQIIEHFNNVHALRIHSGWIEIDGVGDLKLDFCLEDLGVLE